MTFNFRLIDTQTHTLRGTQSFGKLAQSLAHRLWESLHTLRRMRRGVLQATFVACWGVGEPTSLSLNERFLAPPIPVGGRAGLTTGDLSSRSHVTLRVRMRSTGVPDAWGADWTIARLRRDCPACMQGVKCVALAGLRCCLYIVSAFTC
jgi:hypothetical protein